MIGHTYAANQVSKRPAEIQAGEYVFTEGRWAEVDHVDQVDHEVLIHLVPVTCDADALIPVCTAGPVRRQRW